MNACKLSIVIISHNQRELLRRCIESVLQQRTDFPVEVIVSDDRSDDGTREMLLGEYGSKVISTFCNSDECNPAITLERASFNRLNGLKKATGKYLIHIDGDDFFTSTDLFQSMVDTLDAHPECTMCCQNFAWVEEDKLDEPYIPFNTSDLLKQDGIISGAELCTKLGFVHNSCFCCRRSRSWAQEDLDGIPYDDEAITFRYLENGRVAILNRCDFVYVQYNKSSFNSFTDEEKKILFQPGISKILLLPQYAGVFLHANLGIIAYIADRAIHNVQLSETIVQFLNKKNTFIQKHLGNKLALNEKVRYRMIYLIYILIAVCHLDNKCIYKLYYRLAIGKIGRDVKF